MSRRGDPELIYQAQREGVFRRLVYAERVGADVAEQLLAQWERLAEAEGITRGPIYWDLAWRWIAEQRSARNQP